jgi:uncharacterized protein
VDLGRIAVRIAVGLAVGTLVGLTGLGGGMVLLPVLISVLGVPPIIAVGSDAVINCVTKIGAGGLHWRQGNVRRPVVLSLAYGSIPGAITGVVLLAWIRATYGNGVNHFLRLAIGILLIIIPVGYLFKPRSSAPVVSLPTLQERKSHLGVTLIGFFALSLA